MSKQINEKLVDQHYGQSNLTDAIFEGLEAAGKNLDTLTPDDLAPVDQFHVRGKVATLELAQRAGLKAGMHVLDVGGGIGGTARVLASEFNCKVTVLDLTEEYIRTGEALTQRMGLKDRIMFQQGNALDMPFPDMHFDLVWTQHSTMNIADKEQLFAEIWRVLRPGSYLALHEIMAGKVSPVYFPVPWARDSTISEIRSSEAVQKLLEETGFHVVDWADTSTVTLAWFQEFSKKLSAESSPLGFHLLLGKDFAVMVKNQVRNVAEHRIAIIQGIAERTNMQ